MAEMDDSRMAVQESSSLQHSPSNRNILKRDIKILLLSQSTFYAALWIRASIRDGLRRSQTAITDPDPEEKRLQRLNSVLYMYLNSEELEEMYQQHHP